MSFGSADRRFPFAAVIFVLLAALGLRTQALWTPHWRGDQAQYIILAMKLSHAGLNGYNLRGVSLGHLDVSPSPEVRIEFNAVKPGPAEAPGSYLELMKSIGQSYYDEPLHVRAPLFPVFLALSHKIFVGASAFGERTSTPTFTVLSYGPHTLSQAAASFAIWRHQLWAALVPLAFNLGLILLTAVLAWSLFGSRWITVLSAAVLAVNPISIWLAHKILTESAAAFFVTASVTAFAVFWPRNRALAGLTCGLLAGVAVLVNQRSGLILPALGGFVALSLWHDAEPSRGAAGRASGCLTWGPFVLRSAFNPFFWLLAAGFLTVTGFWFWKVTQVYGHPLYQPSQKMVDAFGSDSTGWFAAVHSRPHPALLFSFGVMILCPLFGFALPTWSRSWNGIWGRDPEIKMNGLELLWIWVMTFFLYMAGLTNIFQGGYQEHRYFYPAYPALTILSAVGIDRFYVRLKQIFSRQPAAAQGIVMALVLASAAWGCWQAYAKISADQMLF